MNRKIVIVLIISFILFGLLFFYYFTNLGKNKDQQSQIITSNAAKESQFIGLSLEEKNIKLREGIKLGDLDMARALIKEGANINAEIGSDKRTSLIFATLDGDLEMVRRIIELGADLNIQDISTGDTALMYAAKTNKYEIYNELIDAGARLDLKNESGETVFHIIGSDFLRRKKISEKSIGGNYYKSGGFVYFELPAERYFELVSSDYDTIKSLGGYYAKDKNNYYEGNKVLSVSDPDSFIVLSEGFAKDKNKIYYYPYSSDGNFYMCIKDIIVNMDASTFEISDSFIKDKNAVFELTNGGSCKYKKSNRSPEARDIGYDYIVDGDNIYNRQTKSCLSNIKSIDKASLKAVSDNYFFDKTKAYYFSQYNNEYKEIDTLTPQKIKCIDEQCDSWQYARIENDVYFEGKKIAAPVDVNSFKVLEVRNYARDNKNLYYRNVLVKDVNPDLIEWASYHSSGGLFIFNNNLYSNGIIISGVDVSKFRNSEGASLTVNGNSLYFPIQRRDVDLHFKDGKSNKGVLINKALLVDIPGGNMPFYSSTNNSDVVKIGVYAGDVYYYAESVDYVNMKTGKNIGGEIDNRKFIIRSNAIEYGLKYNFVNENGWKIYDLQDCKEGEDYYIDGFNINTSQYLFPERKKVICSEADMYGGIATLGLSIIGVNNNLSKIYFEIRSNEKCFEDRELYEFDVDSKEIKKILWPVSDILYSQIY